MVWPRYIMWLFTLLLFSPVIASADELHGIWNELLTAHVHDGRVDYQGFKEDEKRLDEYLAQLAASHPETLDNNDQLALYINGYNAYTVKLILENFKDGRPVQSIKDIGGLFSSPWSIRLVRIGGEVLTLDNVEHDIIRPRFKDPRVHFAINCASQSCPPLRSEAYRGAKLDNQLNSNTRVFINNQNFTYVSDKTLYVSKIFDWFSEDFQDDAVGFVKTYAEKDLLQAIETAGNDLKVKYLKYDWSLNDK